MPRVVHFEIHAADVDRAVSFYRDVFGWTVEDWSSFTGGTPYFGLMTGEDSEPGINGAIKTPGREHARRRSHRRSSPHGPGRGLRRHRCRHREGRRIRCPAEACPRQDGVAGLLPRRRTTSSASISRYATKTPNLGSPAWSVLVGSASLIPPSRQLPVEPRLQPVQG
jgi:catechol 2,3-dioxygenase-like lactoylglutathione lyase family enzyme